MSSSWSHAVKYVGVPSHYNTGSITAPPTMPLPLTTATPVREGCKRYVIDFEELQRSTKARLSNVEQSTSPPVISRSPFTVPSPTTLYTDQLHDLVTVVKAASKEAAPLNAQALLPIVLKLEESHKGCIEEVSESMLAKTIHNCKEMLDSKDAFIAALTQECQLFRKLMSSQDRIYNEYLERQTKWHGTMVNDLNQQLVSKEKELDSVHAVIDMANGDISRLSPVKPPAKSAYATVPRVERGDH